MWQYWIVKFKIVKLNECKQFGYKEPKKLTESSVDECTLWVFVFYRISDERRVGMRNPTIFIYDHQRYVETVLG